MKDLKELTRYADSFGWGHRLDQVRKHVNEFMAKTEDVEEIVTCHYTLGVL